MFYLPLPPVPQPRETIETSLWECLKHYTAGIAYVDDENYARTWFGYEAERLVLFVEWPWMHHDHEVIERPWSYSTIAAADEDAHKHGFTQWTGIGDYLPWPYSIDHPEWPMFVKQLDQ